MPTRATDARAFAPILAVQFIGTLGYSIALPFLVFLVLDFGGASWTYGVVGATYSAFQLIGAPLLGRWSDRVGRRTVLVVSQAGTFVAWIVFIVALAVPMQSLGDFAGASLTVPLVLVFVARALDGATGGNVSVASAYVADLTKGDEARRRIAFGRMGMAASLGFTIGPAVAGLLGATRWGYLGPVVAATVVSGVATVMCLFLRDPGSPCPDGPPPPPAVSTVLGQQQRRCDRPVPPARPGALRRPIIVALLVATFAIFLAFNVFYAGFPVHAGFELAWDTGTIGLFYAVLSGTMIIAQGPLLKRISEHVVPAKVFAIGMLGLVAALLAFSVRPPWAVFAGAVLFAIGNGLSWPTFQARLADAAGDEDQGAVQGAATSAAAAASILGLVVGGLLYPWLGVWLFVAAAILFALIALGTPLWFRR